MIPPTQQRADMAVGKIGFAASVIECTYEKINRPRERVREESETVWRNERHAP